MPLKVVNNPATFQDYTNLVLLEYLDLIYIEYLDDILIYSKDINNHSYDIRKILKRLLKNGLFMKLEKYVLKVLEISFLGFILRM